MWTFGKKKEKLPRPLLKGLLEKVSPNATIRQAFEAFFTAYPKTKTTNPKAEAFDVWARLSSDDQAAASASLPRFAEHCREQFNGYQPPGAVVYLRRRRFDDFAPSPTVPPDLVREWAGLKAMARAHFEDRWHPNWALVPARPVAQSRLAWLPK
jgi:hypothetical protein